MPQTSKRMILVAIAAALLLGAGMSHASIFPTVAFDIAMDAAPADAPLMTTSTEQFPPIFPPLFSDAWFTGTWCYISCSDGTFSSVRTWSTQQCCNECAEFCNSGCIAEGGGPSVLCGGE